MLTPFASYCDEFGHVDDPTKKFMGIAGLLGRSDKWDAFELQWKAIQKEESIPNPFHMVDFVHQKEKFKTGGWESEERRTAVLRRLLGAIENAEVMPVGASVVLQDYKQLSQEQKKKLGNPYCVAFQEVTFNIAFAVANMALNSHSETECFASKVSMVYAKLKKYTGPAEQLWREIREANMVGQWMDSYAPEEPSEYGALQAADIWAYSLGHMGEHQPPKKTEAETAFEAFVDMAQKRVAGHKFFTLFDRKEMLIRLGEFYDL